MWYFYSVSVGNRFQRWIVARITITYYTNKCNLHWRNHAQKHSVMRAWMVQSLMHAKKWNFERKMRCKGLADKSENKYTIGNKKNITIFYVFHPINFSCCRFLSLVLDFSRHRFRLEMAKRGAYCLTSEILFESSTEHRVYRQPYRFLFRFSR